MVKLYFSLESLDVVCRKYLKVLCAVKDLFQAKVILTSKCISIGEFHLYRAKAKSTLRPFSRRHTVLLQASPGRSPGEQIQICLWGTARRIPSGGLVESKTTRGVVTWGPSCKQTDTTDNVKTLSRKYVCRDNNLILELAFIHQ